MYAVGMNTGYNNRQKQMSFGMQGERVYETLDMAYQIAKGVGPASTPKHFTAVIKDLTSQNGVLSGALPSLKTLVKQDADIILEENLTNNQSLSRLQAIASAHDHLGVLIYRHISESNPQRIPREDLVEYFDKRIGHLKD